MEIPADILAARERMKEKFEGGSMQIGGRRKPKKVTKPSVGDDRKVQQLMKRNGASNLTDIEEVRMVKDDDTYMSFNKPKIQASPQSNTYMISGSYSEKSMDNVTELLDDLASHGMKFDSDKLNMLMQNMPEEFKMKNMEAWKKSMQKEDDDVPIISNFDEHDEE